MSGDLRLAFVGQRVYFGSTVLQEPAGGVTPAFFALEDGGPGLLRAQLTAFAPDVVVVFRPELLPHGTLDGIEAVTVGFLTEPLPRPGRPTHPDLELRLGYLRAGDLRALDRIVSYDPYLAGTVDPIAEVWRALPLPVSDSLFLPVRHVAGRPQVLFNGRATAHRDAFLDRIKKDFDVVHLAHGVVDERLAEFLLRTDIGINLHNEPYPNYENRVSTFLAAGLLVISEPLSPRWGLQPGIDYLEISEAWEPWEILRLLRGTPDALHTMRASGRARAERFRASTVWPALAREALADVGARGSTRAVAPAAR